jgi:hypothetical protein
MSNYRQLFTALAALVLATPVMAQSAPAPASAPAAAVAAPTVSTDAPVVGPTLTGNAVGVRAAAAPAPLVPAPAPQARSSSALMVVGVAALLVGAVVGGDEGSIVMIVGGVMALVGLWRYVQ